MKPTTTPQFSILSFLFTVFGLLFSVFCNLKPEMKLHEVKSEPQNLEPGTLNPEP